ncbi:MAG TPA: septum formation family protein [Mycobacterium sp.]|nr:septum formation family protein [Mycobacterium sp.]
MTEAPPDPRRAGGTNGWAIAAFVLGILGGTILSVTFAIVALFQLRGRHQRGRGLAVAALVISAAWIAAITSVIAYGLSAQGNSVHASDLTTGDCIKDTYEVELPAWVKRVRCDRPHYGEVFAVETLPADAPYPADQPAMAFADRCGRKFFDYAPNSPEGPTFRVAVAYPTADGWANGERSVVCVAISKHERWSSLRDKS